MSELRLTSIKAPARLVCGAVIELLAPRCEIVDVQAHEMTAVLPGNTPLTARCVERAAGTSLTCELDAESDCLLIDVTETAKARAEALVGAKVIVGTAIVRDGRLLVQQRAWPADAAGRWELPGGHVDPGEGDHDAVRRECLEELGITVEPGDLVGPDIILPNSRLLRIYAASTDGEPVAVEHEAVRWLTADELADVDWLPADRLLLPALHRLLPT